MYIVLYAEKDWVDIKKMPEHGTLSKDFKRSRYSDLEFESFSMLGFFGKCPKIMHANTVNTRI